MSGYSVNYFSRFGGKGIQDMGMFLFPLQVLCNPKITITDPTTISVAEACLSIDGFSAIVPRAKVSH